MYGERTFNQYGSLLVKDKKNSIFSEVFFNPEKKGIISGLMSSIMGNGDKDERGDYIEGVISTKEDIDYVKNKKNMVKGIDFLEKVHGHWTEDLFIGDQLYWHIDDCIGFKLRPVKNPLPSDCRFREDLIELKKGDESQA